VITSPLARYLFLGGSIGLLATLLIFIAEKWSNFDEVGFRALVASVYLVATISSYLGHATFTFKKSESNFFGLICSRAFLRHVLVTFIIATAVSYVTPTVRELLFAYMPRPFASAIAFVIVALFAAIVSFFVSKFWIFREAR
jgi:putative flippase GtrA